jgi:hypothetical protein
MRSIDVHTQDSPEMLRPFSGFPCLCVSGVFATFRPCKGSDRWKLSFSVGTTRKIQITVIGGLLFEKMRQKNRV